MSVMVLLVLAVVWVVALTPMVLRKLSERRVVTSVTSFNRQLGRLRTYLPRGDSAPSTLAPIGFSAAAQRVHDEARFDAGVRGGVVSPDSEHVPLVISRTAAARRRRVLGSLLGATAVCFLLGLVPALGFLSDLGIVCLVLTVAYVGLLVYFRRLAVERVQKVVALETRRNVASALDKARAVGGVHQAAVVSGGGAISGSGWSVTGTHDGSGAAVRQVEARVRFQPRELAGARG